MSSASLALRQISRAKNEAEASLAKARSLRDQWLAANDQNSTGLTQKEVDYLSKAFKNAMLTVKWDCEDLEELLNGLSAVSSSNSNSNSNNNINSNSSSNNNNKDNCSTSTSDELLAETKCFIEECRLEMAKCMKQLEEYEYNRKIYHKHGITTGTTATTAAAAAAATRATAADQVSPDDLVVGQAVRPPFASIIQNPFHVAHYERLEDDHMMMEDTGGGGGGEVPHFDKSQIELSTTIFNNALYEHFEDEDAILKSVNATKVFNNLTRPSVDDVCVGTNENEMILEMLETEYYNPPAGLLAKTKYATAIRNFFDADRNRFLGTIAFLFSFPILLILFLVI